MNHKRYCFFFFSSLFATIGLDAGVSHDWPLWRGPSQNGLTAPGQDLPLDWSESKNVIWKAEIPGRGHGSPIVIGNQVILPTSDEKKKTQSVLCLDRKTGKLLWTTQVHEGGFMKLNKKGTHASGSLACDGKRLYVNFLNAGAAHTTALSMDGKILWQTKITDYVVHQAYASSPALHGDNLLIVAADNKKSGAIACLNRTDGKIIWKIGRPKKPNYASPVIYELDGRKQLIMTGCDLVSSYNPVTGEKLWEIKGATTECVTTTVTDGIHVYSSGGYPKNHITAIRADGSGKIAWSNNIRVYVPSMIVNKGYLYAIADAGVLYCWKSDTGEEMWKGRLGGTFSASLTLADGKFYAANEAGDFFVAEASPKQFKILSKNKLGDEIFASPVICGKRLFQRTAHRSGSERQEFLYCIGKK
jgi:outer membrane protein assembly factor BamB